MIEIKVLASGSRGNCHWVTNGKAPLLLECGIPYKEIQKGLNFRTLEIDGCLVSHEHADHSRAVEDIMHFGIDCYMSQGTADALGVSGHRLNIIKAKQQFKIGFWSVMPFKTEHDAAEPLGFLLANQAGDKLLYITDSYYCRYKFPGLNYIMIECNHSYEILNRNIEAGILPVAMKNRLIRSHFALENVKKFLVANDLSKVWEIWLIHMSDGNSDAGQFKREIQELTGKPVYVA